MVVVLEISLGHCRWSGGVPKAGRSNASGAAGRPIRLPFLSGMAATDRLAQIAPTPVAEIRAQDEAGGWRLCHGSYLKVR
jgi:hypothetical protein